MRAKNDSHPPQFLLTFHSFSCNHKSEINILQKGSVFAFIQPIIDAIQNHAYHHSDIQG